MKSINRSFAGLVVLIVSLLATAGTQVADKKGVFVIRADGSVVGSSESLWSGRSLGVELRPGDTVVVPEKAYAGPRNWINLFTGAQVAAAVTTAVLIGVHY